MTEEICSRCGGKMFLTQEYYLGSYWYELECLCCGYSIELEPLYKYKEMEVE